MDCLPSSGGGIGGRGRGGGGGEEGGGEDGQGGGWGFRPLPDAVRCAI